MAKLSNTTRRIVTEDYPKEYRTLIDKLGFSINPFFNAIVDAFSKKLTFTDNFNAQIVQLELTAPVSTTIRNPLNGAIGSVIVLSVQNLTNTSALLSSAPFVEFSPLQDGQIQIRNITGLSSGNKYLVKLLLLAE